MSNVSKSVEISLDITERELFENAIRKCKKLAHDCAMQGVLADDCMIFECLVCEYDSNGGKLPVCIEVEE